MEVKEKQYQLNRPIQRKVRFSKEENDYLNQKIAESPFRNFQNFARLALLTNEIVVNDFTELYHLNSQISRVGNNVNQIAKFAYQFQEISPDEIHELLEIMKGLEALVQNRLRDEIKTERKIGGAHGLHKASHSKKN
jgi:hypothetical protein